MKQKTLIHILIGLAIFSAALLLWLLPGSGKSVSLINVKAPLPTVKITQITQSPTNQTLTFSGVIQAKNRAAPAFSVPGRISRKNAAVGGHVEKGQVLMTVDAGEFQNRFNMADSAYKELEIRLVQAKRNRDRIKSLADADAATSEELEQVTAIVDATQAGKDAAYAQMAETRRLLEETELKAPFSGTITAIMIEPGEFTSPGRPVVEISGDGNLELQVEVPETVFPHVRKGKTVDIQLPFSFRQNIKGRITSVSNAAIGPGRLFPVKIDIINPDQTTAGMTAELLLEIKRKEALMVPLEAVINPGSSIPSVFLVKDNVIQKIHVKLGPITGDKVSCQGELAKDDLVVISGHTRLKHGDHVEVRQ